jgi:hypothetical protein
MKLIVKSDNKFEMSYITIFTAPKPFTNSSIDLIQRNAIRSWQALGPDVEVLLMGEEEGMAEAAKELGVRYIADVKRSQAGEKLGPPFINAMYDVARQVTNSPMLLCANADVIFFPDLIVSTHQAEAKAPQFIMFGQRWDLEVLEPIDFSNMWVEHLQQRVRSKGKRHPALGSDYFISPRDCFTDIPEFAIGRSGWDNWMIYHAFELGIPAIDASYSINVIHQNHDYNHLPGGKPPYRLEETERNRKLAGGKPHMYLILDTNVQLIDGKLCKPRGSMARRLRRLELALYPKQGDLSGLRRYLCSRLVRLRRMLDRTGN